MSNIKKEMPKRVLPTSISTLKKEEKSIQTKNLNHELKWVKLGELKDYEKNPRINGESAEKLLALIESHGFVNPFICTRDNIIRAGHTRKKAEILYSNKYGIDWKEKSVPVIYVDFLTEADAVMYMIADNKSHEWSKWDNHLLAELMKEIPKQIPLRNIVKQTGFTQPELEGLGRTEKTVKELMQEIELNYSPQERKTRYWCWFELETEIEFKLIMKEIGQSTQMGREINTTLLFERLNLKREEINIEKAVQKKRMPMKILKYPNYEKKETDGK